MATKEKKWVVFEETLSDTGKTKIWRLFNVENEHFLGEIRWYGGFRKYVFYPSNDSLYAPSCLREITEFIETEMLKRKL